MSQAEQLLALIERETGQSSVLETALDALDLDSLEFVDLVLRVEIEFATKIPEEALGRLSHVRDFLAYLPN